MIGIRVEEGLSPRVRGKLNAASLDPSVHRSIPACTGETPDGGCFLPRGSLYPRVYGGNKAVMGTCGHNIPLSPRVRGKPYYAGPTSSWTRSIPACTGETHLEDRYPRSCPVYPRVYGGNL